MVLVFDAEATGAQRNKAHPFDPRNKVTHFGFKEIESGKKHIFKIEYDEEPYGSKLKQIQELLNKATLLVGFNLKYDLHWLRRYNLALPAHCRLFDVQVSYYILTGQRKSYPSLDGVAEYYGHPLKYDVVKNEYWDQGLDTDQVPEDILVDYLGQDLDVTENCYNSVAEEVENSPQRKVIAIANLDLGVLEEMEYNGFLYDKEDSLKKGDQLEQTLVEIDETIRRLSGIDCLNCNSPMHLSAMLYGGTISTSGKEEYIFTYKDGRTAVKERKIEIPHHIKGYFKPLDGTALAKEGLYSTNAATLVTLSETAKGQGKEILDLLLKRAKLEQQRSTYYHGYPKQIDKYNWEDSMIRTNFNQCVAVSGRLSSSKPNIQNVEEAVKYLFKTRFPIRRRK